VSEGLQMEDTDEVTSGLIHRTYSGFVECKANAWDTAYQAAATRARALGGDKHPVQLSGRISVPDNQQNLPLYTGTATRVTTGDFIVRVTFSFEYQVKGSRSFIRLQADQSTEAFGPNGMAVSGTIAAPDPSTARSLYATLRALYVTTFIRSERLSEHTDQIDNPNSAPVGATRTPAPPRSWGTAVNGVESTSGGMVGQFTRLDFSFQVHTDKTTGQDIAIRFRIETDVDYITRRKVITIEGEAFGQNTGDTDWAIAATISAVSPAGQRLKSKRSEAREKWLGHRSDSTDDRPSGVGYLMGTNFSETYEGVADLEAGILDCQITEKIRLSGPRVVVLPSAFTRDVIQECGIASGERTISGYAVAGDEATARAFAQQQKQLPLPGVPDDAVHFWFPDEYEVLFDAAAKTALIGRGENARLARYTFTFREVLPDEDQLQ